MKADFNFQSFLKDRVGLLSWGADRWATKVSFLTRFLPHQLGKGIAEIIDDIGSN
jgi:hypothetical protein